MTIRVVDAGDRFALGKAVVVITGDPDAPGGGEDRALVPRLRVDLPPPGGTRSAIIAASSRFSRLDALAGRERHADVLVVPRAMRASDRPGEAARRLGTEVLVHSGGQASARTFLARLGSLDAAALVTAHGAVWAEIRADGSLRHGRSSE